MFTSHQPLRATTCCSDPFLPANWPLPHAAAAFTIQRTAYVAILLLVDQHGLAGADRARRSSATWATWPGSAAVLFQILAPLQLALAVFFSALLAASAVAQEKDRRTLVLLLLTHLSNSELVLGKLLASLLNVLVLLGGGLAAVHVGGPVGRRFVRPDRPGVRRHPGQPCWPAAASARRWPCGGKRRSRPWP